MNQSNNESINPLAYKVPTTQGLQWIRLAWQQLTSFFFQLDVIDTD